MSALSRRRGGFDVWPGFVDALTSLIMVLIFLLLLFAVGQAVLTDKLMGKDSALNKVNNRVAELDQSLSQSELAMRGRDARIEELERALDARAGAESQLRADLERANARESTLGAEIAALKELNRQQELEVTQLQTQAEVNKEALAQQSRIDAQLDQANRQAASLREQLAKLLGDLETANKDNKTKDAKITDLGQQLNLALASQVSKLQRYRSEFFGRLREALGNRKDVQVVGDRFVVPTDILFESGSADLDLEAQAGLQQLVSTLRELSGRIPANVDWVLRIDGHTDKAPIHTDRFPSNWELSTARALAIVKYLAAEGIPQERLAANGFGEFQPIDPKENSDAFAKNRRIELQLTNR